MTEARFHSCIEACRQVVEICEHTASACLAQENAADLETCIRLNLDTAAICSLVVHLMARDSRFIPSVTQLCAQACETCATECEKYDYDFCKAAARACRGCADECRKTTNQEANCC